MAPTREAWASLLSGSRPTFASIRISFRLEYNGAFAQWKLLSVEELPSGVASKALDRERDFPKVSPWPPGGIKWGHDCPCL
jgi:hypothetical protein